MLTMLHGPRQATASSVRPAVAEAARRLALAADAILAAPFRWAERRRSFALLAEMDDHTLSDIGLSRFDLRDASSLDYRADPLRLLELRRDERRRAAS